MNADFWRKRWSEGQIGWHRQSVNPQLEKWWPQLEIPAAAPVLMPLAGKSLDVHWLLDQAHSVLAVELSEIAIAEFFAEADLQPGVDQVGQFERSTAHALRFLKGDIFDLDAHCMQDFRQQQKPKNPPTDDSQQPWAWYDRAALVALPPETRPRYMQHLAQLLPPLSLGLLLSFEYPQHETDGPPFAVEEVEVRRLCDGLFECELLEREVLLDPQQPPSAEELLVKPNRYVEKGLTRAAETIYRLQRMA